MIDLQLCLCRLFDGVEYSEERAAARLVWPHNARLLQQGRKRSVTGRAPVCFDELVMTPWPESNVTASSRFLRPSGMLIAASLSVLVVCCCFFAGGCLYQICPQQQYYWVLPPALPPFSPCLRVFFSCTSAQAVISTQNHATENHYVRCSVTCARPEKVLRHVRFAGGRMPYVTKTSYRVVLQMTIQALYLRQERCQETFFFNDSSMLTDCVVAQIRPSRIYSVPISLPPPPHLSMCFAKITWAFPPPLNREDPLTKKLLCLIYLHILTYIAN